MSALPAPIAAARRYRAQMPERIARVAAVAAASDGLPLQTDRVRLRRLREADLDAFAAYRSDAALGRWQGWTPMSRDASLAFLQEMQVAPAFVVGAWLQIGIADAGSDGLIGDLGLLLHDAATAEIGFTLSRPAQGRGLAREAVAALLALLRERTAVQRVRGVTDARNAASARLMAALGWRHVASEETLFRGERCTEWTFECDIRDIRSFRDKETT